MQPDAFTFLQSARREMALGAAQPGNVRGPYLQRAAQVLERLAFHQEGLEALLAQAIPQQEALVECLRALVGVTVGASSRGVAPPLEIYERNNRQIETLLGELANDPRMRDATFAQRADELFREVSQFGYDITHRIAEEARRRAREWEAKRASIAVVDVTAEALTDYLRRRFPQHADIRVSNVTKLTGMNANEAFFIRVDGHPDWPADLILRRSLPAQIQPTSITEEFAILEKLHGGPIPVPFPVFCEEDRAVLGQPFVALERLRGEVLPLTDLGDRGKRGYLQLAALMGRLHSLDPMLLPDFRRAADGDALAWLLRRIDVYEREWRRGSREPVHTVTAAFHWLRRNAPQFVATQVIVHGDMDHRNLLIDGDEVVAVIDWEVAHQGHPAEDLAYVREHVERLMPWRDFVTAYEANGGKRVGAAELRYAKVLSNLLRVTTSMIAHVAYVDGVIDNFLMGSVRTIETEAACQALHDAISS